MRSYVVSISLVAMLAGLGLLIRRPRTEHIAPKAVATVASSAAPSISASASTSPADAAVDAPAVDKALQVIALGWDLAAPGIVANGGPTPSKKTIFAKDVEVQVATTKEAAKIEAALARGGAHPDGADVAILPLPTFVAQWEHLRALDPQMFLVVAWSHGREALVASKPIDIPKLASQTAPTIVSSGHDPATFLALYILELAGVAPAKVKASKEAGLAALDRGDAPGDARALIVTTADASRVIPIVAVAPRGVIQRRRGALLSFARGWLEGIDLVQKDATAASRQVAEIKGADEPIALLQRLGQLDGANLRETVEDFGLSGRSAIAIAPLFLRTWSIWKAYGALTIAPPDQLPLDTSIVAELVRTATSMPPPSTPAIATEEPPVGAAPNGAKLLFVHRTEAAALGDAIGWLAGTFQKAKLRVAVRGGTKVAKAAVIEARDRFGLGNGRLIVSDKEPPGGAAAAVEVWL